MRKKIYKYIYGPVPSWRLGSSLGIDPLSQEKKICSFDCIYCQIGETGLATDTREIFVTLSDMMKELESLPRVAIDYVTFSGRGEPTLAKNLGKMIQGLRKIRNEKIAVITNSSLLDRNDVQQDLGMADLVIAKLDAVTARVFELVNKPIHTVKINTIIKAMKDFKSCYRGKLALQIMFMAENKEYAKEIAEIAREISPDEVQLNTPLRPCRIKPLSAEELAGIESYFNGLNVVSVYKAEKKNIRPISSADTLKRRGKV